ncbi:MAG: carbohydrate kinase [Defluviimonas sp.]|uniref:carbohydrate kinase family protein n=1 Tax=Albidovulum sp. TaxID=1872424 RepID=UPI001D6BC7DF|nr:carbohydrate kinase [Paracoccaceae bacterium]MCC0063807.1 carbohydrate kinase [Defluviimonas sp.]
MILCCGEALIDMLPRRATSGEDSFAPHAGGAVFNTAIALGRLGAPAGLLSGISRDLFGEVLIAALDASNVSTAQCIRSDRPTTLAFVRLANGQASYAFYDENTAGRMIGEGDLPALAPEVTAMFFGGISLVSEPGGSTYETLMHRAAASGRVTMIDPNVRPSLIGDEAAYRARIARMIGVADIVKLSDEDLGWLEGGSDIAAGAAAVRARGPKAVFVTEGAKGAHGFSGDRAVFVPSLPVAVVDTVGAGDTFNAGVLAALQAAGALDRAVLGDLGEDMLAAALSLGNRAAAVTVSRAGANPPWASELG